LFIAPYWLPDVNPLMLHNLALIWLKKIFSLILKLVLFMAVVMTHWLDGNVLIFLA
jgi:hypothetical protein